MARSRSLRSRIAEIVRRYKHVNKKKFFYNKPVELRRTYRRISVWYLIQDPERGYSIMNMEYKRLLAMHVGTWAKLHQEGIGSYASLYSVFTQSVLPAINNKGGNKWRFVSMLGWAGVRADRSAKSSTASRGRNKAAKKRNANARRRRRR